LPFADNGRIIIQFSVLVKHEIVFMDPLT
jgi:hypothetical protein